MRALSSASVVTVAAAASLLWVPAAFASPHGGSGTVRMHDAASGRELSGADRQVCSFFLVAAGFDGRQQIGWKVVERASGTVAETGELLLDGEGSGRSGDLALDEGRYRLVWDRRGADGEGGGRRAFEVDCDGVPVEETAGGPQASASPSPSASAESGAGGEDAETPDGDSGSTPTATEPAAETTTDEGARPTPNGSDERSGAPGAPRSGDLAETGSEVPAGALAAAGASLLGAGTYLVLRRREGRAQRR
ncbi:LPXTG cell wall anchor domain-containing protein [Streptomyces sp. DSM 42041]|uniref:LPXTG cell wall anchor domain-containing protein n=1 Tax=Streptomyces hazeniae TaxID=3075538 RepID=A0ABU2P087_9ACTN|nr:LPXTG cell wall anchor domain-containing protein [Streptomyces sp. DSM 42041]MDT0382648.1 LPXTG cell wall anchor domain-containing protein [Streptomyces sp. DSM 42041]